MAICFSDKGRDVIARLSDAAVSKGVAPIRPYICYGDAPDITLEEFREHAAAHGVTVIQAHPLRDGKNTPHPEIADGFEVINSSPRHENFDGDVRALALKHGLLMSAGSDAHRECDVGGAAVLSEKRIETVDDYLELLRSGKAVLVRNPRAAV